MRPDPGGTDPVLRDTALEASIEQLLKLRGTIAQAVEAAASKRRQHQLEMFVEPLECKLDASRLGQIVRNLVENAYKYTPDRTRVSVTAQEARDGILLEVSDDGPGIPVEKRSQLFEAFSRIEETAAGKEGVGLGLFSRTLRGRVRVAGIQFRMLNRSKGPAVWAPRAQCDRGLYRRSARFLIEQQAKLHTIQGTVARLVISPEDGRVTGVETLEGRRFGARSVVITTGTFLRGRIHIGTETRIAGGRAGEGEAMGWQPPQGPGPFQAFVQGAGPDFARRSGTRRISVRVRISTSSSMPRITLKGPIAAPGPHSHREPTP